MSELVGYRLLDAGGNVVQSWGGIWGQTPGRPNPIRLPNGDDVHAPELDTPYGGCRLVEWFMDPPPPPFENLSRPAFIFMMGKLGISKQDVYDSIDQMPDGDEKTLARIVFDDQQTFKRDNALLATLTAAAGLTPEQVDNAWRIGEALTW